jgi:hypothetical protein
MDRENLIRQIARLDRFTAQADQRLTRLRAIPALPRGPFREELVQVIMLLERYIAELRAERLEAVELLERTSSSG